MSLQKSASTATLVEPRNPDDLKKRMRSQVVVGNHVLPPPGTRQAQVPHQPFDGAARHPDAFAVELGPDLVGAVHEQVLLCRRSRNSPKTKSCNC